MNIYKCPKCGWDDSGSGDTAHICGPVNIKKAPVTIQTVAANLRNTIAGKEAYVQELAEKAQFAGYPKNKVYEAMTEMLDLNINELKSILADVEKCVEKEVYDSWKENPDRMGGQFTQDEIDNANRWN